MKLKVSFEIQDNSETLKKIPAEGRVPAVIETVKKMLLDIGAEQPKFQFDEPVLFAPKDEGKTEIKHGNSDFGVVTNEEISLAMLQDILEHTGVDYNIINIPKNIYPITG